MVEAAVCDPDEALQRLIEGNRRHIDNKRIYPNQTEARRAALAQGQQPFATILGCVDSRVSPEIVFDRGLGDLLVIRTAGQVIDHAVMGSIEFGAFQLGIPLLLVLGHEKCGAVMAAIESMGGSAEAKGSIRTLIEAIRPAVAKARERPGDLLQNAVNANIELGVQRLRVSPVLKELLAQGKLKIVGGRYDLDTGAVEMTVS